LHHILNKLPFVIINPLFNVFPLTYISDLLDALCRILIKRDIILRAIFLGSIGTIADTSLLHLKAFNRSFEKHRLNWEWSSTEYREMLKMAGGIKRIQRYADENCEKVDAKSIHNTKSRIFQNMLSTETINIRPGIREIFEIAHKNKVQLALVTTTSSTNVVDILSATGIDRERFDVIITNEMVKCEKPDPEAYNLALRKLGLLPREVIAIEDNWDGRKAAISAELECFVYPGSMQDETIFKHKNIITNHVAQSISDLLTQRRAA